MVRGAGKRSADFRRSEVERRGAGCSGSWTVKADEAFDAGREEKGTLGMENSCVDD